MARTTKSTKSRTKRPTSTTSFDPSEDQPTEVGQAVLDALLGSANVVDGTETQVAPPKPTGRRLTPEARALRLAGPVRTTQPGVANWQCYSCPTDGHGTNDLLKHVAKTGHNEFEKWD